MAKRVAGLVLCAALLGFWQPPAAAGRVVALVVGNESPDNGLTRTELTSKLAELKSSLFSYGNDTLIIDGMNLSKEEFIEHIRRFESGLNDAELAFFYYTGMGVHDLDGASYLVPQGWDGRQEGELVAIGNLLERMRVNPNSKGLVFLDALKPSAASGWQPTVRPGLGSLGKEADGDKLQIAFLETISGPAGPGAVLTKALVRQLQPERIKLPQFASLVQQDVSFDTGTIHVPRLFGSLGGSLELQRLSKEELAAKQQRCVASRDKIALGEPMWLAARPKEASRSLHWHWFCPEASPPLNARPAPDRRPSSREVDKAHTRQSPQREQASQRSERAPTQRTDTSQRGRSYDSASGPRAAASAVPTP